MARVPSSPSAPGRQARSEIPHRAVSATPEAADSTAVPMPLSSASCFGICATVSAASAPPSMTTVSGGSSRRSSATADGARRLEGGDDDAAGAGTAQQSPDQGPQRGVGQVFRLEREGPPRNGPTPPRARTGRMRRRRTRARPDTRVRVCPGRRDVEVREAGPPVPLAPQRRQERAQGDHVRDIPALLPTAKRVAATRSDRRRVSSTVAPRATTRESVPWSPKSLPDLLVLGKRRRPLSIEVAQLPVELQPWDGHCGAGEHRDHGAPGHEWRRSHCPERRASTRESSRDAATPSGPRWARPG